MARQISECLPAWLNRELERVRAAAADNSAAQIEGGSTRGGAMIDPPEGSAALVHISAAPMLAAREDARAIGDKGTGAVEAPASCDEGGHVKQRGKASDSPPDIGRSMITASAAEPHRKRQPQASAVVIDLVMWREMRHAASVAF
jgi:hypothetical protein